MRRRSRSGYGRSPRRTLGPFEDLEVIRVEAGMSTARFCKLIDMPERTWRRWQAKARQEQPPKGPGRSRRGMPLGRWW